MENPELKALIEEIRQFVKERDWEQFHTPKNLSMALAVEAAELMEHFQWLTHEDSLAGSMHELEAISQEIADVFVYILRLSDVLGIDLIASTKKKLTLNGVKYPADSVRGSAKKYSDY